MGSIEKRACNSMESVGHAWRRKGPWSAARKKRRGVDGRRARQAGGGQGGGGLEARLGARGGMGKQNKRGKPLAIFH